MCENCTKKVSIPALEREKKCLQLETLPRKKKDNCTTLPSNVLDSCFCPQISVCEVYLFLFT
ncbi:hypothetical protein AB205_0160770 [Aquarana catesbeiana]|uniref:Uncharacterized protein n=1 Tax=Aquarana catesbeiana TaxID=8400 RepID=A0A2G9RLD3_AQUCT|nr:hypothetical protein AB205_0160770 [Aquarana catesbeiana]